MRIVDVKSRVRSKYPPRPRFVSHKWSRANTVRKVEFKLFTTSFLLLGVLLTRGIAFLARRFSPHLDAMGIVHQAIEDAVGDGGIADLLVPARDRHRG
jgi:hypothetical protein